MLVWSLTTSVMQAGGKPPRTQRHIGVRESFFHLFLLLCYRAHVAHLEDVDPLVDIKAARRQGDGLHAILDKVQCGERTLRG